MRRDTGSREQTSSPCISWVMEGLREMNQHGLSVEKSGEGVAGRKKNLR